MSRPESRALRLAIAMTAGSAAVAALAAAAIAGVAVYVARTVVVPPRTRVEDIRVVSANEDRVTLARTADSQTPGRYSLWFHDDKGHARLGDIESMDATTVTRAIVGVDRGDISTATGARMAGWFYLAPEAVNLPFSHEVVDTELGPAPAWLFPVPDSARWVIAVHGRAVIRQEALRAVPALVAAGFSTLVVSYRNDGEAPRSLDGRYALGDSEWRDVDAAIAFAMARGAREVVLMGWSMGGATVLQAATRGEHRRVVTGIVLDSPVVDWLGVLEYHGTTMRIPTLVRLVAVEMISRRWGSRLTGQAHPIDLGRLDFVARAAELDLPILLFHSNDDGYVPSNGSRALAASRPDIVTFEEFEVARHTKLWNYDPERWNRALSDWLGSLPIGQKWHHPDRQATG